LVCFRTHAAPRREKRIHDSRVVLVNPDMDEHMAPSMVSYFQRRLGMKTPFPAEPEQPSNVVEYVPAPDADDDTPVS
jgi:hypothetical protein